MLTFFLVVIPLFILGPLALCFAAFRIWFPKHTLKINQTLLLPLALPLFCVANIYQLYQLKTFVPALCDTTEIITAMFLEKVFTDSFLSFSYNVLGLVSFYAFPVMLTCLIAMVLRKSWNLSNIEPFPVGKIDRVLVWLGRKTGELLLNHMGQLTAYDPRKEEMMVDIYTNEGFLFSGKYSNYFSNGDGNLEGVSMTNAIRHRIAFDDKGQRLENDAYIIPNQGEIFFPTSKIANFHVWKITYGQVFTSSLKHKYQAHVLAWYLSLRIAMKSMNLRVKVRGKEFDKEIVETFVYQLEKLKIDGEALEFESESKAAASATEKPT